jgi:hypothetical protein
MSIKFPTFCLPLWRLPATTLGPSWGAPCTAQQRITYQLSLKPHFIINFLSSSGSGWSGRGGPAPGRPPTGPAAAPSRSAPTPTDPRRAPNPSGPCAGPRSAPPPAGGIWCGHDAGRNDRSASPARNRNHGVKHLPGSHTLRAERRRPNSRAGGQPCSCTKRLYGPP